MEKPKQISVLPKRTKSSRERLIRSVIEQFNLASARPDQVKTDCDELRLHYRESLTDKVFRELAPLFPLLQKRSGQIAEHLFSFIEKMAEASLDPLPYIKEMLNARDKDLVLRALVSAVHLAEKGTLTVSRSFILFLAKRMNMQNSPLLESKAIQSISLVIKQYDPGEGIRSIDPILYLYLNEENMDLRRLAARLLDSPGNTVQSNVAESILGKKPYKFFLSYLTYSRISHSDLLCLQFSPSLMDDFTLAEKTIGTALPPKPIVGSRNPAISHGTQIQPSPRLLGRGNLAACCGSGRAECTLRFFRTDSGWRQQTGSGSTPARGSDYHCRFQSAGPGFPSSHRGGGSR